MVNRNSYRNAAFLAASADSSEGSWYEAVVRLSRSHDSPLKSSFSGMEDNSPGYRVSMQWSHLSSATTAFKIYR